MVRVPGLGPGGRRFESFHPDHFHLLRFIFKQLCMVGLAQLVRALVCGAGGRGFESRIPPHFKNINLTILQPIIDVTSVRGSTG